MTQEHQSHLDATCPVYYCCGTAQSSPVTAWLLWGDQSYCAGARSLFCCPHSLCRVGLCPWICSAKCISVLVQCSVQLSEGAAPQHSPGEGQVICVIIAMEIFTPGEIKLWRTFSWSVFLFLPTLNLCPSDNHKIQAFPVQTLWN